jgi:kynurenine formamidase
MESSDISAGLVNAGGMRHLKTKPRRIKYSSGFEKWETVYQLGLLDITHTCTHTQAPMHTRKHRDSLEAGKCDLSVTLIFPLPLQWLLFVAIVDL